MSSLLSKLINKFLIEGITKLGSAFYSWVSRKIKEKARKKKATKFEESGDEKDLLDLEDDLNS